MTIEFNIETTDLVDQLAENPQFQQFLDSFVEERVPSPGIQEHDFTQHLREALQHGCFEVPEGTFSGEGMTEHAVPDGRLADMLRVQLGSMPFDYDSRCALGREFTTAVRNVLIDILRGTTEETRTDGELEAMLRRLLPGAIVASEHAEDAAAVDVSDQGHAIDEPYVSPSHTDEDVPVGVPRLHIEIDVSTPHTTADVCRSVTERVREAFPGGDASVTVEHAAVHDAIVAARSVTVQGGAPELPEGMTREVAVFTMSGLRDGPGAAHVYTNADDSVFLVTKTGFDGGYRQSEHRYTNQVDAFTKAMALVAWNSHAVPGRVDL